MKTKITEYSMHSNSYNLYYIGRNLTLVWEDFRKKWNTRIQPIPNEDVKKLAEQLAFLIEKALSNTVRKSEFVRQQAIVSRRESELKQSLSQTLELLKRLPHEWNCNFNITTSNPNMDNKCNCGKDAEIVRLIKIVEYPGLYL